MLEIFISMMKFNLKTLNNIAFWASVLGVFAFIFDFGFSKHGLLQQLIDIFYFIVVTISLFSTFGRYIEKPKLLGRRAVIFDLFSIIYTIYIFHYYFSVEDVFATNFILRRPVWITIAVLLSFVREFSEREFSLNRSYLTPAQTFIVSFIVIIFIGSFLLSLPNATHSGISYIDALFTSTSAVCVTGLAVVDTGTYFTTLGQFIILILIQIGGLGILTFASYFNYFFKGRSSYENQLALSEMTNTNRVGNVFSTLKNIILITTFIELTSSAIIFFSLDKSLFSSLSERLFFSVFHGISAFCNAGFSTLSNSAYQLDYRFNYVFQMALSVTLIIGGLGFPIVMNMLNYLKRKLVNLFTFNRYKKKHRPWVVTLDSRITLVTTITLTVVSFFFFLMFEYNNTLAEHSFLGKLVTAFFGATTPRTAGFNSVDMGVLTLPTILITFFLMWVGASPASTGGGIKTSTFAIAILNIFSISRGKSRIEVFRREISDDSIRKAFATIVLSLIVIGFGVLMISFFEPNKKIMDIAFECFSAYSTVGLSLGITGSLTIGSRIVLIIIMFVGRVSMLSILMATIDKVKQKNYRYPKEELTVN